MIGHLARPLPDLTGLLLAQHRQVTVSMCTEDLTLHGCGLLAKPPGMLLDVAPSLANPADGLVDLRAAGVAVH